MCKNTHTLNNTQKKSVCLLRAFVRGTLRLSKKTLSCLFFMFTLINMQFNLFPHKKDIQDEVLAKRLNKHPQRDVLQPESQFKDSFFVCKLI